MTNRVYGIDLGTTYSCISYVDEHGKPVVVPNAEGDLTTPSVVYFESPDNVVVGATAKENAPIYKDKVVSTIKRRMGDPNYEFAVDGKTYKPQEISSFILKKIVHDAAVNTGDTIKDVVITCPAYFGVAEKEATKQAGIIAGLNVLYVIPEPTAAAIAYGVDQTTEQTVLVYDLGGGTFDVTVITIKSGEIAVVATGGDDQLGGKDWDDDIVAFLAAQFEAETGTPKDDLLNDTETYQQLLNDAEKAKVRLSSVKSMPVKVSHGTNSLKVELTREKFAELTVARLERTVSLTEAMIARGKEKGAAKIDKILLVGGSTYMPQVLERIGKFPFEVKQFDPNQAVAKGAALFGYICALEGELRLKIADATGKTASDIDLDKVDAATRENAEKQVAAEHGMAIAGLKKKMQKIRNVASKSFGVVVQTPSGEKVSNLVVRDDTVPRDMTRRYSTFEDGTNVLIQVMQSQETAQMIELSQCVPEAPLGTAVLEFARELPKNSPLEVTFHLTPDGLLKILAKDLTTNVKIDAEFQTDSIMTIEEVEAAKSRALSMSVT